MPPDWTKVAVDHVRQACELFDAGAAVPRRPAKSTFLIVSGKAYPAKFIRGEAYRIATGVELDPNRDFTGGNETARFFADLGFETSNSTAGATSAPPIEVVEPSPILATPISTTERRYEPQKQALFELLKKRFGTVEVEAKFPWLVVPLADEMSEPVNAIFQALKAMRGHSNFARADQNLRCDFVVPSEKVIIEYDEKQHFTVQRAKTLELYSFDLALGFDRSEWITACNSIRAVDLDPPYRDEQRAFYDALRDILAAENGYRLIRFRQKVTDWTDSEAERALAEVIPMTIRLEPSNADGASEIKRIALIAHNYNIADSRGFFDYSEHFARINKLCDDQGCDTILYALFTWAKDSPSPRTRDSIFGGLSHVGRVILEVGNPPNGYDHVEIWSKDRNEPLIAKQRFSRATDGTKQFFLDDLTARQIGSALLMICGESNIVQLKRKSKSFDDPYGFENRLRALKTRVILNPIHDYMTRYEMREKRRFYSREGRTVVSVWNRGRGKEAWFPWTVFHDGNEVTDRVLEISNPFSDRPDIRIGVCEVAS